MEIRRNMRFDQLNDRQKIAVCLEMFKLANFDIEKMLFTVQVKHLDDLKDDEIQDVLKTYVEIEDFATATYIRDFFENRKKQKDAGAEKN
jgi:hypothetical protein